MSPSGCIGVTIATDTDPKVRAGVRRVFSTMPRRYREPVPAGRRRSLAGPTCPYRSGLTLEAGLVRRVYGWGPEQGCSCAIMLAGCISHTLSRTADVSVCLAVAADGALLGRTKLQSSRARHAGRLPAVALAHLDQAQFGAAGRAAFTDPPSPKHRVLTA